MNAYLRTGLILLLGIGASFIFSWFIEKGLGKYHAHTFPKVQEIFNAKTNYAGLYLGSSRAHTNIRPSVIDSITSLTSYNAGTDAANLFETKMIFDGYLKKHPAPQYLVIILDPFSFDMDRKMFYPLQYFRAMGNPVVRSSFREMEDYNLLLIRNIPFLRMIYYTDYIKKQALRGLTGSDESETFGAKGIIDDKGFVSLGNNCMDTTVKPPYKTVKIEDDALTKIHGIIETCKARKIKLILAYAPEYNFSFQSSFTGFDKFIRTVDSIAVKNKLPFFRDDSLQLGQNHCLFANFNHLNNQGAFEYSRIFGQRIAALIKEQ